MKIFANFKKIIIVALYIIPLYFIWFYIVPKFWETQLIALAIGGVLSVITVLIIEFIERKIYTRI